MNSSAVDARVVIAVEKLLDAGCVLFSEKNGNMFHVQISIPEAIAEYVSVPLVIPGESFSGHGHTFPEAFNDAHRQLPEQTAAVAA